MKRLAIDGQRFGRLQVLEYVGNRDWRCQCDCGAIVTRAGGHLRNGGTRSCGCLRRNLRASKNTKHGQRRHPLYERWLAMIQRCRNPHNIGFARYGGRGIRVADRWHDFAVFLADVGNPPSAKHTIGRINNDGNYQPDNFRWETPAEQSRNTRRNRLLTFNGRQQCATDWAAELGIPGRTLRQRLENGWTVERALSTPRRKLRSRKKAQNQVKEKE